MSSKIKNTVIAGMLIWITIPFILLTDIFPFMRFGMFAEPVKTQIQMEVFEVSYITEEHMEATLDPKTIGLEPHFFSSLARNYYYRKEPERFLENISQIAHKEHIMEWRMRKIIPPYKEFKGDTTVVSIKRD